MSKTLRNKEKNVVYVIVRLCPKVAKMQPNRVIYVTANTSSHDSTLVIDESFLNYYDLINFSYGAIPFSTSKHFKSSSNPWPHVRSTF